jgi:hypothetical protein
MAARFKIPKGIHLSVKFVGPDRMDVYLALLRLVCSPEIQLTRKFGTHHWKSQVKRNGQCSFAHPDPKSWNTAGASTHLVSNSRFQFFDQLDTVLLPC